MLVIFFAIVTPIGLLLKIFGKDLLKIKKNKLAKTYWTLRENINPWIDNFSFTNGTFKSFFKSSLIVLISLLLGIIFCEAILRIKHSFIINYDIEMWKYAKKLKIKVNNAKINHVHVSNSSANLQNVEIKINRYGQRDIDFEPSYLKKFDRSFLILGSSVAMGWGVESENVFQID